MSLRLLVHAGAPNDLLGEPDLKVGPGGAGAVKLCSNLKAWAATGDTSLDEVRLGVVWPPFSAQGALPPLNAEISDFLFLGLSILEMLDRCLTPAEVSLDLA